jgi:hypothetical protein
MDAASADVTKRQVPVAGGEKTLRAGRHTLRVLDGLWGCRCFSEVRVSAMGVAPA